MTAQERLTAFKQALALASVEFGIRLAIVQQIGAVVLDEPTLGYMLVDTPDDLQDSALRTTEPAASPSPLAGTERVEVFSFDGSRRPRGGVHDDPT